jgi:hypothetical protein
MVFQTYVEKGVSPLVKRLTVCLHGKSLEIQGHLALELAAMVDCSGLQWAFGSQAL